MVGQDPVYIFKLSFLAGGHANGHLHYSFVPVPPCQVHHFHILPLVLLSSAIPRPDAVHSVKSLIAWALAYFDKLFHLVHVAILPTLGNSS